MPLLYQTYALALPSGRHVCVRSVDAATLLARNQMLLPLTSIAASMGAPTGDERSSTSLGAMEIVERYCRVALVSPRMPEEVAFEEIPYGDALAIYHWAIDGLGTVHQHGERSTRAADFAPMIAGEAALFLDTLCSRYHIRPSHCLDMDTADFALDLDLAVAYRGLRREADAMDGESEVEDMWGGTHRVPKQWLAQYDAPRDARVARIDTMVERYGTGVPLSIGGEGGDAMLAPMPRPGSLERSRY